MSPSQFQISPCTLSDRDSMSDIYTRAFSGTPMTKLFFPPTSCARAEIHAWNNRRIEKDFRSHPETHFFKVTDLDTGRMVGWARWGYPHAMTLGVKVAREQQKVREDEERTRLGISPFPEGANVEACAWFFATLESMREEFVRSDECYVLYFLGVDPAYQRRGVGSMLIRHCLDLADAEGAKAYLEGTQAGHALHLKMGWKDVHQFDVDLARWDAGDEPIHTWVMIREPQGKT